VSNECPYQTALLLASSTLHLLSSKEKKNRYQISVLDNGRETKMDMSLATKNSMFHWIEGL
jgi:hypothetical protein